MQTKKKTLNTQTQDEQNILLYTYIHITSPLCRLFMHSLILVSINGNHINALVLVDAALGTIFVSPNPSPLEIG